MADSPEEGDSEESAAILRDLIREIVREELRCQARQAPRKLGG